MATMFRRAMLYLGLGPDDDYDEEPVDDRSVGRGGRAPYGDADLSTVRPIPVRDGVRGTRVDASGRSEQTGRVRRVPGDPLAQEPHHDDDSGVTIRPSAPSVVRPIPASPSAKPHVVMPQSFNHAQEIADRFRDGQPVIMNLQQLDRDLSRRLIDFASGLCYGLNGKMEKVANQVYLLTPANVEVSAEDRRRIGDRTHD
jgi:cell division inhibitor SepF